MNACRVLVVSERSLVGESVASMVEDGKIYVAGSVSPEFLEDGLAEVDPDIVIIDATDRRSVEDLTRAILRTRGDVKIAVLAQDVGIWSERSCRAFGAVGSLSCNTSEAEFMRSLEGVRSGERLRGQGDRRPIRAGAGQFPDECRVNVLTPRELEVLIELGRGEPPEVIAGSLGISTNTVRTHVQNLMLKLAVHTRLEAVALARKAGLLDGRPKVARVEGV